MNEAVASGISKSKILRPPYIDGYLPYVQIEKDQAKDQE